MMKIVLVRHGESEWNKLNLFTGWMDVDLSDKGKEEAKKAKAEETLKKKKTYTLKVTGLAKGDSVKSYKSSKKGVASVTKKGKIRAIKKGKAVITVTLKSGKTAKCKITVK